MSSRLSLLQNKPLRERVVAILREAILAGQLKPGDALVETDLAAQLGISRAPLREALQQLAAEGLIETVAYHGARVRLLTRTDVEELYSLRIVYETFAAQRIIEIGRRAEAGARLRAIYGQMANAAEAGDLWLLTLIDRNFHDAIIDLCDHALLRASWSHVSLRIRQVMALRHHRMTDLRVIAQHHLRLLEAIEAADRARSTYLLREHIAAAGDRIAAQWEQAETNGRRP